MSNSKAELVRNILGEMWMSDDWIDPMDGLLNDWTPEQASKPLHPNIASAEQMINHTAFWEDVALRHLTGESLESLGPLEDAADGKFPDWMPRWPQTAAHYREIRDRIDWTLGAISDEALAVKPHEDGVIRETRISSRAVHAAYHAGQLSFMRRLAGLPEPQYKPRSADTGPKSSGTKDVLTNLMHWAWESGHSFDTYNALTQDLTTEEADRNVSALPSITHIVNHMAFWEEYVAKRLKGEDTDNMPTAQPGGLPPDPLPWPAASDAMLTWHGEVERGIGTLSDKDFWEPRPGVPKQFEQGRPAQWLVYGIANHYAYHLGQIVLLRQMMGHKAHFIES